MGLICNSARVQIGFQRDSKIQRNKSNKIQRSKTRHFVKRNRGFVTKRGYRTRTIIAEPARFLQYIFPCKKENRRSETRNKSEAPQPVSPETTLQNGLHDISFKSSQSRRLGNLNRFKRCIFSHTSSQRTSEILTNFYTRPSLPIRLSTFRSNIVPSSFHKGLCRSSKPSTCTKSQISGLSGRLVSVERPQTYASFESGECPSNIDRFGIYDQSQKVSIGSNPEHYIHWGQFQFDSGNSVSYVRKTREDNSSSAISLREQSNSFGVFTSFGSDGIMYSNSTKCQTVHETNTVAFTSLLETVIQRHDCTHSINRTPSGSFTMVVTASKHSQGAIVTPMVKNNHIEHRCVNDRLGCEHRESNCSRDLVNNRKEISHILSRVEGCFSGTQTLSTISRESESVSEIRQCNSCPTFEQARGNSVTTALLFDMGSLELGYNTQYRVESSSHSRQVKHSSGSIEQAKNQVDGMVTDRHSSIQSLPNLGQTSDRSVCVDTQSKTSDFLHLDTSSLSPSDRCSVNRLGGDIRVCVSTNLSHSKSSATNQDISVQNHSDSTMLAQETLVHRSSSIVSSKSNKTTHKPKSSVSTKVKDLSPKSRSVQPDCMAAVSKRFRTEGFSKRTRELLRASWRSGTQKDYTCKFKRFDSWCSQRKIDPYTASLVQCADFLTSLYHDGLQYRTIAGYRSMLSILLPPVGNFQVGQHPYIIRLLKGVFNLRPPSSKLVPEWELPKVLAVLQKHPFEPLRKASLKYLTLKCVFLTAITTFRRCSDLQALKLGEGAVTVQNEGVTFLRQGLSKQDRPGHLASKIFVPKFEENKLLDPKRTLALYLKRTECFRRKTSSDVTSLFLSINEPHQPVTSQTLSRWIVQVIKMAYEDNKKSVKAHSTRAIGPSWALFNGASMKAVLTAADWSREETFIRFYLREVQNTAYVLK